MGLFGSKKQVEEAAAGGEAVLSDGSRVQAAHRVESIDLRRRDLEDEAWDRVVSAILDSDLTITI